MAGKITYNGIDPFGAFVPLVERSVEIIQNNGYISHVDKFVLSGFLSRDICSTTWAQYHQAAQDFLDVFSRNFGIFQISELRGSTYFTTDFDDRFTTEDGSFFIAIEGDYIVYNYRNAIIRRISFDDNSFYNLVPYSIEIDCIRSYKDLGVVEPVDEWTTDQSDDALITVTHRMSCRGVGENAFDNAEAFIQSLKSQTTILSIPETRDNIPILSRRENKNRLTGEFSLTETFLYNEDKANLLNPFAVISYTSEISESQGETTVVISGSIQHNVLGQENVLDFLKITFDAISWDAIADSVYGSSIDKNGISIQEDEQRGVLNFTLTYSSLSDNSPYLIDETTISRDLVSGKDCISLSLTVRVDYGCGGQRFEAVKAYANALNFDTILLQKWVKFGTGQTLSTSPESKGWTENPIEGTVTLSAQYCTKTSKECGCLQNFDFTLDFAPGGNQFVAAPIYRSGGFYDVQDLNAKTRARYGLNGSAVVAKCCSNEQAKIELQGRVNSISNFYFPGSDKILEESNITETSNREALNFSFRWSTAPI